MTSPPDTPSAAPAPPAPPRAAATVHLALILVQLWFASLSVVAKVVLRELAPHGLMAARVTLAALIFLGIWAARGCERVAPRDMARIASHALFGIVINQMLFLEGLSRSTATNAVVLGAAIPVLTVAVALVLGRERATPLKLLGLGVALAGALAVTGVGRLRGGSYLIGNLLILTNGLSFSIYLVIGRGVLARYRASTVIAFTFAFGALVLLPLGAADLARDAPHLGTRTWLWMAYIVAFPSVGTYLLNAWALARVESSVVAIYIYLQPLVGAGLAALALGERPTIDTLAGGAAILAGIWLVGLAARRRR